MNLISAAVKTQMVLRTKSKEGKLGENYEKPFNKDLTCVYTNQVNS